MDSLSIAFLVFLGSALCVVLAGVGLARYGDELAEKTGWGRLWVGTLLVGIATSLPEVAVNVSAIWLEDSPGLALGNVFGANMINLFVMASVAMIFGVHHLFGGHGKDTEILIVVAIGLVALALIVGVSGDIGIGSGSLGGVLIAVSYIIGMRLVYNAGRTRMDLEDIPSPAGSARGAWIGFGISALVVIVAGRYLAASADRIAEISGIGASFIGVLLVSIVTTLPEGSVTVAASMRKSYGIAMGNVYGSCAFNVTIISIADLFNEAPLLRLMEPAHFAAAIGALVLLSMGYLVFKACHQKAFAPLRAIVPAIPLVYVAALYLVFVLGQT